MPNSNKISIKCMCITCLVSISLTRLNSYNMEFIIVIRFIQFIQPNILQILFRFPHAILKDLNFDIFYAN